jgi:hypothetical protein
MNLRRLGMIGAAALALAVPTFADTYYGGFEDLKGGDYDYNDIVFTLSGNGLKLNTTDGKFYSKPALPGTSGNPFWNNASLDGPAKNVGYCIYGGGNCGAGISATAQFLANSANTRKSADNVFFSTDFLGQVNTQINVSITAGDDQLYYYYTSAPGLLFPFFQQSANHLYFYALGDFGIAGVNKTTGSVFYSQSSLDSLHDPNSHFAFFGNTAAAPEPGAMGLMGGGLLAIGALFHRRKNKA